MADNEEAVKSGGPEASDARRSQMQGPWWAILIAGIVALIFGCVIIAWPLMSLYYLKIFFGLFAIIIGLVAMIRSFTLIKKTKTWWIMLLEGILGIIIGICVFAWPVSTLIFIVYFIAAWLLITGISAIVSGSNAKSGLVITWGVCSMLLGLFIFFRPPFYAAMTLVIFLGFFAIFRGIAMIAESIAYKVATSRAEQAAIDAQAAAKK